MTDAQLDWDIAMKVLGWTAVGLPTIGQTWIYPSRPDRGVRHEIPPFSSNLAAAWKVVERLQELGWHARLLTPFEPGQPYFCGFTPQGTTGWNGRPDHEASAETMPLAICRAALMAVAAGLDGPLSPRCETEVSP